jgi:peptide deformylase
MIVKKITQLGDPLLRQVSVEMDDVNSKEVKRICKNLVDTMRDANLVGISAPQIGISRRIIVTEICKTKYRKNIDELDKLHIYINPIITKFSSKKIIGYEGCGSVGNASIFGQVKRSETISVKATDLNGEEFERTASGLLSVVIQHEIDHLDGIVFTDKLVSPKSLISASEYRKIQE